MARNENVFDLKWNDFSSHLSKLSASLLNDASLLDISIQCGTEIVKAHKFVLAACSPWFQNVIQNTQVNTNSIIVLWDSKIEDMKRILSFMYNGEVQVEQEDLLSFLKLAGYLQVKGLTDDGGEIDAEDVIDAVQPARKRKAENEDFDSVPKVRPNLPTREPSASRKSSTAEASNVNYRQTFKKENVEFFNKKEVITEETEKVENSEKSDFETKRQFERAKIKEMRVREAMKNAGRDRSHDRIEKKKTLVKKETLEQFKALNAGNFHAVNSDRYSNGFSQDIDPSQLVKTEIEDNLEDEINQEQLTNSSFMPKPSGSTVGDVCNLCGKGPFSKGKISTHMKNVHSNAPMDCTTCNKQFKCERYLQAHKRQYCPDRFKQ